MEKVEILNKIDEIMLGFIKSFNYQKADEIYSKISSGKKLRSRLILKIAGVSDESLRLSAIVELIHLASLLHDDVIDESDTRRGKASINAKFGDKNAIMMGDLLYSKGFFELSKFDPFIAQTISRAVSLLSVGELMDVELSYAFSPDKNSYYEMIYNKTAILIEASAKTAAYLAKTDPDKFGEYGKNLGLAFQIVDDILDITSDSKTLGKPALSDFKDGKTTLPYIYLFKALDGSEKEKLKILFRKELSNDDEIWLKNSFKTHKIIEKCIDEARNLAKDGILAIDEYKNEALIKVMQSMVDREF